MLMYLSIPDAFNIVPVNSVTPSRLQFFLLSSPFIFSVDPYCVRNFSSTRKTDARAISKAALSLPQCLSSMPDFTALSNIFIASLTHRTHLLTALSVANHYLSITVQAFIRSLLLPNVFACTDALATPKETLSLLPLAFVLLGCTKLCDLLIPSLVHSTHLPSTFYAPIAFASVTVRLFSKLFVLSTLVQRLYIYHQSGMCINFLPFSMLSTFSLTQKTTTVLS